MNKVLPLVIISPPHVCGIQGHQLGNPHLSFWLLCNLVLSDDILLGDTCQVNSRDQTDFFFLAAKALIP